MAVINDHMGTSNRRLVLKEGLISGMKRYAIANLFFFLMLILVRIFECLYLKRILTLPSDFLQLEFRGLANDALILLNLASILFLPFLLVFYFSRKIANIGIITLFLFFAIVEIALIRYLGSTSLILGNDLFGYSLKEVIDIASAGGGFSIQSVFILLCFIFFVLIIFRFVSRIKPGIIAASLFLLTSFVSLAFNPFTEPDTRKFNSELSFNLTCNKAFHLFLAAFHNVFPEEVKEASLFSYFYTGTALPDKSFEYISDEYPFLHKDKTPDVLGKYFNIGKEKPNLVFIIVESLGRAYSGEGAYLHSFTPFLDSLENKSLYWENVLSTAGRTFEVLPSIFGSLPYGKKGIAEMGAEMPEGLSLINLLKQKGYTSRFFYGGDADFDNMRIFLQKQHIDYIIDEKDFGPSYTKMPVIAGNFTWGYGDREIFRNGFEKLANSGSSPRLDIYLTLAMHDPYQILDQSYYQKKAEEKFSEFNLSETQKNEYRKYLSNYATMLYFNDAIRYFFNEYKKRPEFQNTIFFITGDHRMSSPPISSQIDRFHVPLIIYSPMIKTPVRFSSVVSHLDFTPSVVSFLRKNYDLKFPSVVPWLGQGLDSCQTFRNMNSIPFIRTKNEIIDYLDRDYFIVNNQLFRVSQNLEIDEVRDDKILTEIQRKFEKFKSDNLKACFNNRLIPDSLVYKVRH